MGPIHSLSALSPPSSAPPPPFCPPPQPLCVWFCSDTSTVVSIFTLAVSSACPLSSPLQACLNLFRRVSSPPPPPARDAFKMFLQKRSIPRALAGAAQNDRRRKASAQQPEIARPTPGGPFQFQMQQNPKQQPNKLEAKIMHRQDMEMACGAKAGPRSAQAVSNIWPGAFSFFCMHIPMKTVAPKNQVKEGRKQLRQKCQQIHCTRNLEGQEETSLLTSLSLSLSSVLF